MVVGIPPLSSAMRSLLEIVAVVSKPGPRKQCSHGSGRAVQEKGDEGLGSLDALIPRSLQGQKTNQYISRLYYCMLLLVIPFYTAIT